MEIVFQKVTPKDVDHLRDIALRTFIQSYKHLNTEANFEAYISEAFTVKKLLSEIVNEESFYYFILYNEKLIGYLKLNINGSQTEKYCKNCLEIERIYLDIEFKGLGIGKKAIQFAVDKAKLLSKPIIWLGVWDQNPRAIQFYKNQGFKEKGSHIFRFGDEDQIDIIMERSITNL